MEQARIEQAPNGSLLTYITIADAMVNYKKIAYNIIVFPELKWPPFFAYYSLNVILIEKREINLDIDRVLDYFFPHKCEFLYRLGLDGILVCFFRSSLN